MNPLDVQVGGQHYKKYKIQPVELYNKFNLGFGESNLIKYSMRHQDKNGLQDLDKVDHYCDLMIQFNNPVGDFMSFDYIEHFAHMNNLSPFAKQVIEEVSLWLLNNSSDHLQNIKSLLREERSKYKP